MEIKVFCLKNRGIVVQDLESGIVVQDFGFKTLVQLVAIDPQ